MADTKSKRQNYTADFFKGDFEKAVYLDSVHSDNLMTAFLGLGAEHWALRPPGDGAGKIPGGKQGHQSGHGGSL